MDRLKRRIVLSLLSCINICLLCTGSFFKRKCDFLKCYMEILTSIVRKVVEYAVDPIMRHLGYLFCYKSKIDNLKDQLEILKVTRERVQHLIDAAKRNAEEIEGDVKKWLSDVDRICEDADMILKDQGRTKIECTKWSFPNLRLRHQLSRRASKMASATAKIEARGKFEKVSYLATPVGIGTVKPAKDYIPLQSRITTLMEIVEALKDDHIYMIGIWGAGGVGKTMLAKEVSNQVQKDNSFNVVVMVTITPSPDVKQIQQELAELMGMNLTEDSLQKRAIRLGERIKKEEMILVILDDVWGELNQQQVGIPFGNDHKGCKILLTSRSLDVLSNMMGTQKDFPLDYLKEEEAWGLFEKMAGDVVKDPELKAIATEVSKRCAGLPVLIVSVAKALKNKNIFAWRDSLKQLQSFDKEGMKAKTYSALELSYNHLESEEAKSLFLHIALLGRKYVFKEQLFILSMCLEIFHNVDTLEDGRNRLHKLTSDLKASSLLLEDDEDNVRMHDVVREVSVQIASKKRKVFSQKFGSELENWPSHDQLQGCHDIFMPNCSFPVFPSRFEAPELQVLVIGNSGSNVITVHDSFFTGLKELKVLDLSRKFSIPSPISSLHLMTNLKALTLHWCLLTDIAMIGELKNLELLRLTGSNVKSLPREIGQLHQLRLLDLDYCDDLKIIAPGVLSNLKNLQELRMYFNYIKWAIEEENNHSTNASLIELSALHQLTSLELSVKDGRAWPKDLVLKKLKKFRIYAGSHSLDSELSQSLELQLYRSIQSDEGIKALLKGVQDLRLSETWGFENILSDLNAEGFPQLKNLRIENNVEVGCIIDLFHTIYTHPVFPNLELLHLFSLSNLECICNGTLTRETFRNLRIFKVRKCNRLKNLFSLSLITMMSQLVELKVSSCLSMKEILLIAEEDNNIIELPKLQSLKIKYLPSFINFYSQEKTSSTSQMETKIDKIKKEHSLIPVFNEKVSFPKLGTLYLHSISFENLWHDQSLVATSLQNLTNLTIESIRGLKHLLSMPMVRSLVKLKHLEISGCDMMDEIYIMDNTSSKESFFPNMETMIIRGMDNLRTLWHPQLVTPNYFFKLKSLKVISCDKLTTIFPSYVIRYFQGLHDLYVWDCNLLEDIFEISEPYAEKSASELTTNLWSLTLDYLSSLKYIWKNDPQGTLGFNNKDKSMEEVSFFFPQLSNVRISYAPNLKYFYPGRRVLKLPMLKSLHLSKCPEVTFSKSSHLIDLQQNCGENIIGDPSKQPWFSIEEIVPQVKDLYVDGKNAMEIWNTSFHANIFHKIEFFCQEIARRSRDTTYLKKNSHNLWLCFEDRYKEEFPLERLPDYPKGTKVQHFLQNLKSLMVSVGLYMKSLASSSVSFQNLRELKVRYCNGFTSLITVPTAQSLGQLIFLGIRECAIIEEITSSDSGNVDEAEIIFGSLKYLALDTLPELKNFCSGKCSFKFLSLKDVIVKGCPKMELFSSGVSKTPFQFNGVSNRGRIEYDYSDDSVDYDQPLGEKYWEGDLNSTIKRLSLEMNVQNDQDTDLDFLTSDSLTSDSLTSATTESSE